MHHGCLDKSVNPALVLLTMRKAIPRFRSTLAVALMFWCAGTGCLIVSYARGLTSDAAEAPQIEAQAMVAGSGATDAHACCKARHKALKQHDSAAFRTNKSYSEHTQVILPASPAPSGAMSCCPLTSGSIVVASQSQTNDSNSTSAEKVSSDLLNVRVTNAPLAVPLRLPNRAQSYLLGCAFLI